MANWLAPLEARGLIYQCTNRSLLLSLAPSYSDLARAQSSGVVTTEKPPSAYLGVDPTADALHVGHLVGVEALRGMVKKGGYRPIVLVGGATALIGDPSGRVDERKMLDREVVASNAAAISRALGELVGAECALVNNAEWYDKDMSALSLLRDVGMHFRVSTMLTRDSVKSRMSDADVGGNEGGLTFTELSYQILQAHDFLRLFRQENCKVQVGGSDQWGNIVGGVDLIKRSIGQSAVGATFPLVTVSGANGGAPVKLGKSSGNAVWLDPKKTSDFAFYQYFLQLQDQDAERMVPLLLEDVEVARAGKLRENQELLAKGLTLRIRGPEGLKRAERLSALLYGGGGGEELSPEDLAQAAEAAGMGVVSVRDGSALAEVLVTSKLTNSLSESRRLLKAGGVYVNAKRRAEAGGERLTESDFKRTPQGERFALLRAGKRNWVVLKAMSE